MNVAGWPGAHLTYCLNVHPGDAWAEQWGAIQECAAAVRRRVAPDARFGLGLRISDRASRELADVRGQWPRIRDDLQAMGLYAFTVNAFPFGAFHGRRVKEQVYAPDWRTPERRDYTVRVAEAMAGLAPAGASISSLPGSYKAWISGPEDREAMIRNLAEVAAELQLIEARCGRRLHVGLEPEPDCFLETTDECCAFFPELVERGGAWLAAQRGWTRAEAEAAVRRHIGVCVDTCHLAVEFEDVSAGLRRLHDHGILISKVQLSAALACDAGAADELAAFDDPVYLHQVKVRAADGRVRGYPDLGAALEARWKEGSRAGEEWRTHVHVPLYWTGGGSALHSTSDALSPAFFKALADTGVEHLEIETYTFNVLPEPLRRGGVVESIASEYAWVLDRMRAGADRAP